MRAYLFASVCFLVCKPPCTPISASACSFSTFGCSLFLPLIAFPGYCFPVANISMCPVCIAHAYHQFFICVPVFCSNLCSLCVTICPLQYIGPCPYVCVCVCVNILVCCASVCILTVHASVSLPQCILLQLHYLPGCVFVFL